MDPNIERIYQTTPLEKGKHASGDKGRCAMEMVALLAGEKHSDRPACACPVLTGFVITINDLLPDADRQKLKPFIPAMIGTRDGREQERMWFLVTQAVTVFAPLALRAYGRDTEAAALEALGPIATPRAARGAGALCRKYAAYAADAAAANANAAVSAANAAYAAYAAAAAEVAYAAAIAAYAAANADAANAVSPGNRDRVIAEILSTVDRLTQIGREDRAPEIGAVCAVPEAVAAD